MSLYAAANIAMAVEKFKIRGYAELSGVILNSRNIPDERAVVEEFTAELKTVITEVLPRSETVQQAEALGKTVIEAFPESEMAGHYRRLAGKMLEVCSEKHGD